jgi:methionyl-tRNA formyltransferase
MRVGRARYIVAATKPWNLSRYADRAPRWPGVWHLIEKPEDLTHEALATIAPRYVFFPHWSWKVSPDITSDFACVCFHMTDVPYGRGGSPLQNLIVRGHSESVVSALRMTSEVDAGPVYMKSPLSLDGSAQDIFERASDIVFDMIELIVTTNPEPTPQSGQPVVFKRRTPAESLLPQDGSLKSIYDHIRMLDAESYPKAFLTHGGFRLEFSQAAWTGDDVEAKVRIVRHQAEEP